MRKQITPPNLRDTLQAFKLDLLANFNCHRVGIIQSFDVSKQIATVQLVDKRVIFTYESKEPILKDYSILLDCPVFINSDNESGFRRPILPGQECLVLFNDRDIDNWFKAGVVGKPRSNRMHDFSDGLALVGFSSLLNSISSYNNSSTSMRFGDAIVELDVNKAVIKKGETLIELDEKIKFQNAATSLKNIIDDLILIITNLKTVDPISGDLPIDSATATALSDLSTQVNTLLE